MSTTLKATAAMVIVLITGSCGQGGRGTDAALLDDAGIDTQDSVTQSAPSTSRPVIQVPSSTVVAEAPIEDPDTASTTAAESLSAADLASAAQPDETTVEGDDLTAERDDETAAHDDETGESPSEVSAPEVSEEYGWLIQRRLGPEPTGCGSPFVLPGETVGLSAGGFAPHSDVSFTARGLTVSGSELPSITIPPTTADGEGVIDVVWAVPDAPPAQEDPEPRAYIAEVAGIDASGATFVAYMIEPLVAYPGPTICAVADSAATTLGQPVRIPVLDNDVAPQGGSLDPASVDPRPVAGGELVVDASDGSLTFTPDPGFAGTATATYVVYDNWQIGVEGEVTVTVDAGCTITIPPDATEIQGTEDNDVICADDLGDTSGFDGDQFHVIYALGGDDIILGSNGTDWIYTGEGTDIVYGRGSDDRIVVYGEDRVYGGSGFDTIYSADLAMEVFDDDHGYLIKLSTTILFEHAAPIAADDHRHLESFATQVIEVLENDYDPNDDLDWPTLSITEPPTRGSARVVDSPSFGSAIEYTPDGASGSDELSYSICDVLSNCSTAEVHITLGPDHCTITGTAGPDTLVGTPGDDIICGLGGNDRIDGLGGNDVIIAGPGDDTAVGGSGDDRIWGGDGDDTLEGGTGSDDLWGGDGSDVLDGGDGNDSLIGGNGADNATGSEGSDRLWGGDGNDRLDGGAGDDTLWGGPRNDTLNGGPGHDTLWGDASPGVGDDLIDGGDGNDIILGNYGRDTLTGGAGDDSIRGGSSDDTIRGGSGDDEILGNGGDDRLEGGVGDDRIYGGDEDDTIDGGDGDDYLAGGDGDDTIDGGDGSDYLTGDEGTDICLEGEATALCES